MILKYYKGYVSIDKLSEMMNTNQNGTTAYNMKETLNDLGFNSYGLKSNDITKLHLPCIAHVIIHSSYKHYIVIYKINEKKQKILIADPATNLKQITFQEFKQISTGVTIHMKPIKQITYEPKPKIIKFIIPYIKNNLKTIIVIQILSIIISILSIVASLFFPIIISSINNHRMISKIILIFLFLFLFKNLSLFLKNKLLVKFNLKLDKKLQMDILEKILNLPYRYYRRKTTGEITSYFNDVYILRSVINELVQIFFIELPLIVFISLIILKIMPFFLIIILIILLLLVLCIKFFRKKQNIWLTEEMRHKTNVNSYIVEAIIGFETIKNLNITNKTHDALKYKYQKFINSSQKKYKYEGISNLLTNNINDFGLLLITLFFVKFCSSNSTSFITIFILSSMLITSIKNILNYSYQIDEVKTALNNLAELTNKKSENLKTASAKGDIVIKNLSYTFEKPNTIINNLSLKIPFASKVMVTGPSGSGKSTIFKILKGYYKDYQGSIKINNNEIKDYNFNDIAYISQKEILFTGTLEENLNLKALNPLNNRICEIENLIKKETHTLIEENGFNLSDGQKQRIILARALNNFNILIIDESLNQVSVNMERRILKNIFKAYSNKTIIYISHRLDNLDLFEQFIKIKKGKIVFNTKRNN